MRMLDGNIIIYSAQPEHGGLRRLIAREAPAVSAISRVEVPGFHRLTAENKAAYEAFFNAATVPPLIPAVLDQAVLLRQKRKLSLGDALIAATCLVHGSVLVTRNTKDFTGIADLGLLNPFDSPEGLAEEQS